MRFCFVCGKKTEKLIEGYCEDCYNKNFSLIEVPRELTVILCSKCKRFLQRNKWIDKEIGDLIRDSIKILGKDVKIEINGNKVSAKGYLKASKNSKEEVHEINVKIIKRLCLQCSQKLGGYYETIIQLRGNVSNEVLNFICKKVNEGSFFKYESVKDGVNLYIGNKNIANQTADEVKRKYKLKTKKSFKLFTKKEGKDLYRSTILIKCD